MAEIKFTNALNRFFPDLKTISLSADSIEELLQKLNSIHPGLSDYIINDRGQIREHVNLYVDQEIIKELKDQKLNAKSQVHILQAISGG
jgi:molybdopterin synthase sulfur carrier subunit